jgi:hypothetical protein
MVRASDELCERPFRLREKASQAASPLSARAGDSRVLQTTKNPAEAGSERWAAAFAWAP